MGKDTYEVSWYYRKEYWHQVFKYVFAICLTVFIILKAWKIQRFANLVNRLPNFQKDILSCTLGHGYIPLYVRNGMKTSKVPFSPHVADFMLLSGYCSLFRKEGIAMIWVFYHPVVMVYRADRVETILNNSTELKKPWIYNFTQPWLGEGLLTSNGAKWKSRRKLLTPAFHFDILKDFLPVFNAQSRTFVDVLKNHLEEEFIDIVPFVTRCSLDVICECLLGAQLNSQTEPCCQYLNSVQNLTSIIFERWFNPLMYNKFLFKISSQGREFFKHLKIVHDFTNKLINKKREKLLSKRNYIHEENDDRRTRKKRALLDLLLDESIKNNSLTVEDIREEIDTFTFEGHDTTSMGISWAMYLIGLHPGVQEKIYQELESIFGNEDRDVTMDDLKNMRYLECVLKESQRLYPSVPAIARLLSQDIDFQGRTVPKGSSCVIFTYCLHRDPEVFPNPEKFDPDRFSPENSIGRNPFAYVPFSAGPRNCIGQRFALMEEKTVISTILRKYRIRSLDPRDEVFLMSDLILKSEFGLRMEIRPRDNKPEKSPAYFYFP